MSYDLLRNRLTPLIGNQVVVCLIGRVGSTESILCNVGVDYIELRCEAESKSLLIPMESVSTIIEKS